MTEPTATRQVLRRRICVAAGMEFYKRFAAGNWSTAADCTTTSINTGIIAGTSQPINFWKNGWFFLPSTGETRKIVASTEGGGVLVLEYPLTAAPAANVAFEILDTYTPTQIHDALNRGIRESGRIFPEEVIDYSLIVDEYQMNYDLTKLARPCWFLNQIFIENYINNAVRFTLKNGSSAHTTEGGKVIAQIYEPDVFNVNNQYSGWLFTLYNRSLYYSPNWGYIEWNDADGNAEISIHLDALQQGDKICMYNMNQKLNEDFRLVDISLDKPEFPNTLYFHHLMPLWWGFRLRLHYLAYPLEMTTDTSTTIVDQEYLINQTLAYLHEGMMNNNQSDLARHAQAAQNFRGIAMARLQAIAPRRPTMTTWQNAEGKYTPILDPLAWGQNYG